MHSIHYLINHFSSHYLPTYAYIALHMFTLILVLCASSKHESFISHPLHPSLFNPFSALQSTHVPILQCHQHYSFPLKLKHTACSNFLLMQMGSSDYHTNELKLHAICRRAAQIIKAPQVSLVHW